MADSDSSSDSTSGPDWLDVLGIDDLSVDEQGSDEQSTSKHGLDEQSVVEQSVVEQSVDEHGISERSVDGQSANTEAGASQGEESSLSAPEQTVDEVAPSDGRVTGLGSSVFGGIFGGQVQSAERSEADEAEAEAKAKRKAENDARFEERRQRRLKAAEEDDDDGPLLPGGKILAFIVSLGVLYLAVNFVDVWATSRAKFQGEATAAVVLGAAQYNGEPSGALKGRLDRAAELYTDEAVEKIVVTGGGQEGDETTEAKTGSDYLSNVAGIPRDDILLEVDGATTYEQLAATARFLDDRDINDVVVVTDPYHVRRSMLIANEVGLEAKGASTDAGSDGTQLLSESAATAVGRLIGFRRFDAYLN